jgi:hypothetical protein
MGMTVIIHLSLRSYYGENSAYTITSCYSIDILHNNYHTIVCLGC